MRVDDVRVAARGVRLPDLDQLPAQRLAVLTEHAAADDDPLAERLTGVLPREIVVERADRRLAVRGPGQLRQRGRDDHERLLRSPQAGPDVVVVVERRVGADAVGVDDLGERAAAQWAWLSSRLTTKGAVVTAATSSTVAPSSSSVRCSSPSRRRKTESSVMITSTAPAAVSG